MEFSVDQNFIHVNSYMSSFDGDKTKAAEVEQWYFIKDAVFYAATRNKEGDGTETKTYISVEGVATTVQAAFNEYLNDVVKSVLKEAADKTYLQQVEAMADGKTEAGSEYQVKYYTAGDGNLTVEGKGTFTDYEVEKGLKGSGSGSVKYAWDKYLLAEVSASMEIHVVDASSNTDLTMKMNMAEKLSFEVKVAQPDLSGYTKASLDSLLG